MLELIHSDVCGPINIRARGGYQYFITFTDDYSRYGYLYLLHHKSEAFEKFKQFRAEVEKQLAKDIKAIRSNRGGEYLSNSFIFGTELSIKRNGSFICSGTLSIINPWN